MKRWVILALIIGAWFYLALAQSVPEELAITTYYPSPYGSYNELTWGCQNQGRSAALLKAAEGGSINLGGYSCSAASPTVASQPYIRFFAANNGLIRGQIRLEPNVNTLTISGTEPAAFRLRILGGTFIQGFLSVDPAFGTIYGKLNRFGCRDIFVNNAQEWADGTNIWFLGECPDGEYMAGMRVNIRRWDSNDRDMYGFRLRCCRSY